MRKLLTALIVTCCLMVGLSPSPASAWPTNTPFSFATGKCTYQFQYGNVYGVAYATGRVVSWTGSNKCSVITSTVAYTGAAGSPKGLWFPPTVGSPYPWNDPNWHQVTAPSGSTAFAGRWCTFDAGDASYHLIVTSPWMGVDVTIATNYDQCYGV